MGKLLGLATIVILVIAGVIASLSIFTVDVTKQAIVLRVGEVVRIENAADPTLVATDAGRIEVTQTPGLKFKAPFIEEVIQFDRRNLMLDLESEEIQAADQERLIVDAFARYRISDPLAFYKAVQTEEAGRARLSDYFVSSLQRVLASVDRPAIISGQRADLMQRIQAEMNAQAQSAELGVDVIDVRIRRADLPQAIEARVFERMRTARQQEAERIRAEGDEQALEIRARAERTRTEILATAQEQAEKTRGEGDATRNAIYNAVFSRNPEFFSFYRSMEAYRKAIQNGTNIVLSPESDFFRYFGNQRGN